MNLFLFSLGYEHSERQRQASSVRLNPLKYTVMLENGEGGDRFPSVTMYTLEFFTIRLNCTFLARIYIRQILVDPFKYNWI